MSTVTIKEGVVDEGIGTLLNVIDPMPPFQIPHGVYCNELLVGTDFTSGDDVVLPFAGSAKILFAVVVSNVGAIKAFAEADIGGGVFGRKLTISNVTTNIKVLVYYSI